jgi:hypothetical protein
VHQAGGDWAKVFDWQQDFETISDMPLKDTAIYY